MFKCKQKFSIYSACTFSPPFTQGTLLRRQRTRPVSSSFFQFLGPSMYCLGIKAPSQCQPPAGKRQRGVTWLQRLPPTPSLAGDLVCVCCAHRGGTAHAQSALCVSLVAPLYPSWIGKVTRDIGEDRPDIKPGLSLRS